MSRDETIHDVMRRVVAAQPEIFMTGHEGYYRHSDITALILEIGRLRGRLYDQLDNEGAMVSASMRGGD